MEISLQYASLRITTLRFVGIALLGALSLRGIKEERIKCGMMIVGTGMKN
jgi:hypothetical protein